MLTTSADVPRVNDRSRLTLLAVAVAAITMLGIPAHATYGARVAVDEPQYVLTAMSIGDDASLDISDELAAEEYRPFHRVDLPRQTYPIGGSGREVSPHDPLLPLVIALPVKIGGWVAAKVMLALLAGILAALTAWTAIRRFGVARVPAIAVTTAFAISAPLATYSTQIYPEIPAALAVMTAVASMTSPSVSRRSASVTVLAVIALPWLSVKYAPVAAAMAAVAIWRWRPQRRMAVGAAIALVIAGAAYLAAHRHLYGGWTSYATAGTFARTGELSVIGDRPSVLGRSRRLVGLLVDDGFGIAVWMPAWLLAPYAVSALWRRRPGGGEALLIPLGVGWFVATFVALTMHGWWWPGRQVVAVLPLAVIAIAGAAATSRAVRALVGVGAVIGFTTWLWTTIEAITKRRVLVVDFEQTSNPLVRLWRVALPDGRSPTSADRLLLAAWTIGVCAVGVAGWRHGDEVRHRAVAVPGEAAA